MSDEKDIWTSSNCLSRTQMLHYIQGKLDREEAYVVETHIAECPMCSDAFDGLFESEIPQVEAALHEMDTHIDDVLKKTKTDESIKPLKVVRNEKLIKKKRTNWWLAASILLFIGLGGYTVFSFIHETSHDVAMNSKVSSTESKDSKYTKEDSENNGELIQLHVDNTDSIVSNSRIVDAKEEKSIKTIEAKPLPSVVALNKKEEASFKEKSKDESAAGSESLDAPAPQITEKVSSAREEIKIPQNTGLENYASNQMRKDAPKKEVLSTKSSSGGLKDNKQKSLNISQTNQYNNATQNYSTDNALNESSTSAAKVESTNNNNDKLDYESRYSNKKLGLSNYERAMQLYNEGSYKQSIKLFQKALKNAKASEKEDIQFQLAQALLKLNRNEEATAILNELKNGSKYKSNATEMLQRVTK